jgi:hypothetical protein
MVHLVDGGVGSSALSILPRLSAPKSLALRNDFAIAREERGTNASTGYASFRERISQRHVHTACSLLKLWLASGGASS